ncbi:MAG: hypothetical protein ACT4PZ_23200 [Panacagrimonas sp.]
MSGLSPRPAAGRRLGAQPIRNQPWLWILTAAILSAAGAFIAWQKLSTPPSEAVVQAVEQSVAVSEAAPIGGSITESSLEQLLQARTQGDWLVHRLQGAPAILVVEFPDLHSQGLTMNRAAALLEKAGTRRHRVLSDAELSALLLASGDTVSTFYLGHDYRSVDLARFYTMAQSQAVTLNPQELRLLRLLLDAGMLRDEGHGRFVETAIGALVTFSSVQNASADDSRTHIDSARRSSILWHELSHGRYFTDAVYRRHCEFFWHKLLTGNEREVWRRYLGEQGYDTANEDLMINEVQALLMHTPDVRDFQAGALSWEDAELEGLRQRFRLGWSQ